MTALDNAGADAMTATPTVLTAANLVDRVPVAATGGQVVVVPAGATHAFRTSGSRPLQMTSIRPAAEMVTEWLDEEAS